MVANVSRDVLTDPLKNAETPQTSSSNLKVQTKK
jgi:hypothetical protein